jgi:hypothetical protein
MVMNTTRDGTGSGNVPLHFKDERLYLYLVRSDRLPYPEAEKFTTEAAQKKIGDPKAIAYDFDAQLHFVREDWINKNPDAKAHEKMRDFTSDAAKQAREDYRERAIEAKTGSVVRATGVENRKYVPVEDRVPVFAPMYLYEKDGSLRQNRNGQPARNDISACVDRDYGATLQWLPHGYSNGVMGHFVASRKEMERSEDYRKFIEPLTTPKAAENVQKERDSIEQGMTKVQKQAVNRAAMRGKGGEPLATVLNDRLSFDKASGRPVMGRQSRRFYNTLMRADQETVEKHISANNRMLKRREADLDTAKSKLEDFKEQQINPAVQHRGDAKQRVDGSVNYEVGYNETEKAMIQRREIELRIPRLNQDVKGLEKAVQLSEWVHKTRFKAQDQGAAAQQPNATNTKPAQAAKPASRTLDLVRKMQHAEQGKNRGR